MARLPLLGALAALASVALGCATAIPLPPVAEAERLGVEQEIAGASRSELEREESVRYWEIFLTDEENRAGFTEEQRQLLETVPVRDLAAAVHEKMVEDQGVAMLEVVRLSPSVLRAVAVDADATTAPSMLEAAGFVETAQAAIHRRIRAVGARIASASGRTEVAIIPEPAAGLNAFVPVEFGSNRVFVGTELAVSSMSDDELACSIGHEFAHLTEGHTREGAWAKLGKDVLTTTAAVAVLTAAAYANQGAPLTQSQVEGGFALGRLTSFALADVPLRLGGWERGQEREADAVGLYYAWRAGYDPDACASNMLRMARHAAAEGHTERLSWWRTHPVTSERVVVLRKLAAQARSGSLEKR
jgi:predicted Zn-dependent protease